MIRHDIFCLLLYLDVPNDVPEQNLPEADEACNKDRSSRAQSSDPYSKPLPPVPPHRDSARDSAKPRLMDKQKPKPNPRPRTPVTTGSGPSFPHSKPGPVLKQSSVKPKQFENLKSESNQRKMSVDDLRKRSTPNVTQGNIQDELQRKLERRRMKE